MKIAKATIDDISNVVNFKMEMFRELGTSDLLQENVEIKIQEKYQELYKTDKCCHFILYEEDKIVAIGGAIIKEDIPFCFFKTPYYGYIIDVYCIPEKRHKGYATAIMKELLKWLEEKQVHNIKLKPSNLAKPMYEKLGFHSSDEMEKFI